MKVLGFDPGLAHFGWCVAELSAPTAPPVILEMGVWITKKADKKSNVRASADTGRRAAEICGPLARLVERTNPTALLLEAFSASRNASSAVKTSRAFGLIDAIAYQFTLPMFEVSPQAIKLATTGIKSSSKAAVQAAVRPLCTEEALATLPRAKSVHEHIFDAGGAVVTAMALPEFRLVWTAQTRRAS